MGSVFVRPLPFTVVAANQTTAMPAINANVDRPGMIWRTSDLTTPYVILDLGVGASYDYVALIGTNLRVTDTAQVNTGTTSSGLGSFAGTSAPVGGTIPNGFTSKVIIPLGATRTERYMRVYLSAPSHPDTFIQVQRVIVGKAVKTMGINEGSMGFDDQSIITTGPNYVSVDQYDVLPSWKFSTGWISEASWRTEWVPMLTMVGSGCGILFISDDSTPANWQTDAIYGRIVNKAEGQWEGYNAWRFAGTITGFAR